MIVGLSTRILRSVDKKALWKFAWNFGWKGMLSVQKYKKRLKQGQVFPPFLYLSIVNSCNLRCQGCWVDVAAEKSQIPLEDLNRLIDDAKAHGNSFFGLLGTPLDGPAVFVSSVALGVCVDDTIHFFTKFSRARAQGLGPRARAQGPAPRAQGPGPAPRYCKHTLVFVILVLLRARCHARENNAPIMF